MVSRAKSGCILLGALSVIFLGCKPAASAQADSGAHPPLASLSTAAGGTILFGVIDNADTPGKAMANILDKLTRDYGEKPRIGHLFRTRIGGSDALFFTVANHSAGNQRIAGMLIATATGSRTVEAALISDNAARFGKTMAPMLKRLLSVWHPNGATPAASSAPAAAADLRRVSNSDQSASIGLPEGWTMDPRSSSGEILAHGPRGELFGFNLSLNAQNTNDPKFQQNMRMGIRTPRVAGVMYFPYSPNVAQNFAGLYAEWKRAVGQQPVNVQVQSAAMTQTSSTLNCGHIESRVNPDGRDLHSLEALMCVSKPGAGGMYKVRLSYSEIPLGVIDQDKGVIAAIAGSTSLNSKVLGKEIGEATQIGIGMARQGTEQINRTAGAASARMRNEQAAHDQQLRGWYADEDSKSRSAQQFDNYILDRTVIQDNNMYGNGTIGHGTVDDPMADALVRNFPDRFEYVDRPNYWQGTDYHW